MRNIFLDFSRKSLNSSFQGLKECTKGRIGFIMSSFFHFFHNNCYWTLLEAAYWCRWIFALTRTELLDVKRWPFFSACIVNAFLHPLLQTIVQFQELVWFLLCSCDPPWSLRDKRQYVMALFTVWTVTCRSASKLSISLTLFWELLFVHGVNMTQNSPNYMYSHGIL